MQDVLLEAGLTAEEMMARMNLFNAYDPVQTKEPAMSEPQG
jgi:hypothetical protein